MRGSASTRLTFVLNRTAFVLIAALVILAVLSAIIPQENIADEEIIDWKEILGDHYAIIETLGLDRIYHTPAFFGILALLGITLAIGTVRRFYRLRNMGHPQLRARHLGSIIFHLSLLLIMAGIILNYLFKFDGVFALTEGQSVEDTGPSYFRRFEGPVRHETYSRFRMRLDQVHDAYQVEGAVTPAARITLWPAHVSRPLTGTVRTNAPLHWENLDFHFGLKTGYSPELVITDTSGVIRYQSFVRLAARKREGQTEHFDFVRLPELGLQVNIGVNPAGRSTDSIVFAVSVLSHDQSVYEGAMTRIDTIRFGSWRLTMPRLRRWCYVDVVESPYLGLVFFGFWSALAGMTIGLVPRLMTGKRQGR